MLPTGMGKSLTYQISALLLRDHGITLVVTPLVALMADQLANLPACVRGAAIHSNQTLQQHREVMQSIRDNRLDLLFVTPERLALWCLSARDFPIALAVVDEAHCVSVWSHNFRPSYMRLNVFFRQLKVQRVLALTATATRRTLDGIQVSFSHGRSSQIGPSSWSFMSRCFLERSRGLVLWQRVTAPPANPLS